ncbi:MAG: hybrid sensor histidine kinase/response regulator [Deltaproteobacteria bacterium]|nr:hybrid sensor histidine kinase/response regulator [Deltaproteobacteria bacterium]
MKSGGTILVVDDDGPTRQGIEALLLADDHHVEHAVDGVDGLEKARALRPDVILLDIMMPRLDGFETCRALRADPTLAHVPVVVLTAVNERAWIARALDAGADEFAAKPVSGPELRARVRSALRIKRHQDALQSMLRMREDLVHMLVHDMRNPLAILHTYVDILREDLAAHPARGDLDEIHQAGLRLQRLVDEMLLVAKSEAGGLPIQRAEVDVGALLDGAVTASRRWSLERGTRFVTQVEGPPWTLQVDGALMTRVLENLLSNAAKFSPPRATIVLGASRGEAGARIEVVDEGPGVAEEHRARIFDRFATVDLQRKGVRQTGLGLAFCKLAVEAHGGTIRVEPGAPKGSVFVVELPGG